MEPPEPARRQPTTNEARARSYRGSDRLPNPRLPPQHDESTTPATSASPRSSPTKPVGCTEHHGRVPRARAESRRCISRSGHTSRSVPVGLPAVGDTLGARGRDAVPPPTPPHGCGTPGYSPRAPPLTRQTRSPRRRGDPTQDARAARVPRSFPRGESSRPSRPMATAMVSALRPSNHSLGVKPHQTPPQRPRATEASEPHPGALFLEYLGVGARTHRTTPSPVADGSSRERN